MGMHVMMVVRNLFKGMCVGIGPCGYVGQN